VVEIGNAAACGMREADLRPSTLMLASSPFEVPHDKNSGHLHENDQHRHRTPHTAFSVRNIAVVPIDFDGEVAGNVAVQWWLSRIICSCPELFAALKVAKIGAERGAGGECYSDRKRPMESGGSSNGSHAVQRALPVSRKASVMRLIPGRCGFDEPESPLD
jgi:hypothetical protein